MNFKDMTYSECMEAIDNAPEDAILGEPHSLSFYEERFKEHIDYARELFGVKNVSEQTFDCDTQFVISIRLFPDTRKWRAISLWELDGRIECPFKVFKEILDGWYSAKERCAGAPCVNSAKA